jgi:hypothetical protein
MAANHSSEHFPLMSSPASNSTMTNSAHASRKANALGCLLALLLASVGSTSAQIVGWSSLTNQTNLTSADTPMDGSFRFQVGVFEGTFIPTALNTAEWSQYWRPAQSEYYNTTNDRFSGVLEVTDNDPPFTAGKRAYIWGFRGSPQQAEWILFSRTTWTWPVGTLPASPIPISWVAEQANDIILGSIDADGSPFLMKSAEIINARPPDTSWTDWQTLALEGEPFDAPDDDPDNDGASNLLEFVMGTDPKQGGGIPASAVSIVPVSSSKYLQMTIPRRIDHPAILTVEVADHPAGTWFSGPTYTTEMSSDIDS